MQFKDNDGDLHAFDILLTSGISRSRKTRLVVDRDKPRNLEFELLGTSFMDSGLLTITKWTNCPNSPFPFWI